MLPRVSAEFEVKVRVHQGSVLSPLSFINVLEAFSREFRAGVPWEDLYVDDLVIIADSQEEYVRRLLIWKEAMEKKGLRVNAGKTKVKVCGTGLDLLHIHCLSYRSRQQQHLLQWLLTLGAKKCRGLQRPTPNPDYR